MKKIKVIENPSSGRQSVDRRLKKILELLLDEGYIVGKFQTKKKDDAMNETIKTCNEDWDMIIVSGGDGTVNEVAKGMVYGSRKIPVAILSTGTVNDFANYLNLPTEAEEFVDMIKREEYIDVDLGKINESYFVNVAAAGLMAKVGYDVETDAKLIFGRMAYYFAGAKEFLTQGVEPIEMTIESEEYTATEKVILILVSNSSSIGGFKKIAPKADVLDGLLDVIIIKESDLADLASIFINIFSGEHINHPKVEYFKSKDIKISSKRQVPVDIDGEYGGDLPIEIEIVESAFRVLN